VRFGGANPYFAAYKAISLGLYPLGFKLGFVICGGMGLSLGGSGGMHPQEKHLKNKPLNGTFWRVFLQKKMEKSSLT
jgi:hypothetical protein